MVFPLFSIHLRNNRALFAVKRENYSWFKIEGFLRQSFNHSPLFSTSDSQIGCASLTFRSKNTKARSLVY